MTHKTHTSSRRSPVYRDSGFIFDTIEQSEKAFHAEHEFPQSGEQLFYTRYGNPNVIETEATIADLERSEWAVLTSAGMSAIDVALSIFHKREKTGTWLFFDEIYGGTKDYANHVLNARRGIQVEYFKAQGGVERCPLDELQQALDAVKPTVLYFEPVSNPLLIVADGNEIIRMAKDRGITVVVDNTFGTPALWKPLENGADLVVHSATKYFAGHGNITAGVVCGNDRALYKEALLYRKYVGPILSPDDAYRLGTQLKTFELRVSRQCDNAFQLAKLLEAHEKVQHVRYPGLTSHTTHQEAVKTFGEHGFGAMVTFEITGGQAACDAFIAKLAGTINYITTLGDTDSILIHVPTVFGVDCFPYPGMIRFSVGIEPYHVLEAAISQALEALK